MRWLIAIAELALLCWFVVIGIEAFWQRAYGLRSPFNLREMHHLYIGVLFVILGFWIPGVTGIFVQLLGIVVSLDDLYQHTRQTLNADTEYKSPLYVAFGATLWKIPGIPALVRLLDRWWPVGVVLGLLLLWWRT